MNQRTLLTELGLFTQKRFGIMEGEGNFLSIDMNRAIFLRKAFIVFSSPGETPRLLIVSGRVEPRYHSGISACIQSMYVVMLYENKHLGHFWLCCTDITYKDETQILGHHLFCKHGIMVMELLKT